MLTEIIKFVAARGVYAEFLGWSNVTKLTSPAYTSHHPSNPKFVKLLYQHTRGSGQDFRAGGGLSAAH